LLREAEYAEKLQDEIKNSVYFLKSNRDTRKEINKGNWKPKGGWYAITNHSDIHQRYFSDIYSHLSGHSHSSYISAIQIRDARQLEEQRMLAAGARQILCMVISHFLFGYIKLFPTAKLILESDATLFEIVNGWYIQKEKLTHIYGPLNNT
jgi:hypothetical protein